MRLNRSKVPVLAVISLVALVVAAQITHSASQGVARQQTATQLPPEGCICHGPNKANDGTPNSNVTVLFKLDPNDFVYRPGATYNLTVGANETDVPPAEGANQGGFNLKVSTGVLAPAEGFDKFVQIIGDTEATHTGDGDLNGRMFNLTWTAPSAATEAAIFTLYVNTVNGNGQNDEGDHWNGGIFVVMHQAGAAIGGAEAINPEEIGVKWLAHWVGIVSFAAVVATLLIYYFVLKYGESVHTTDHRDRKEK